MSTETTHIVTEKQLVPALRYKEFNGAWRETTLGNLFTFKNGLNSEKEKYGSGIKFINVLDIIGNDLITNDTIIGKVEVTEKELEKNEVIYGDVLFQRSSETREEVGQANIYVDKSKSAVFGGFVIRGRKKEDYDPYYINYLLKTSPARKEITTKSGGSTRYNVGQASLSEVFVNLPPLPEQQKIAAFLTAVDQKIQQLTKKAALLAQYKKGVMQQLFSGKLRFKDENGNVYPDWEEKRLGEVFKFKQGYQFPVEEQSEEPFNNSVEFVRIINVTSSPEDKRYVVDPGIEFHLNEEDLFMVRYGDAGKIVCGFNGIIANNMFRLIPLIDLSKKWHYFYLDFIYDKIHALAGSSTMPAIKFGTISGLEFMCPCFVEQQKIARYLSSIDTKIETINNQITQTQTFKKGLLQQLFV